MSGPSPLEQVKYEFVRYTTGKAVLDVGRGAGKAFPHFVAVRLPDDEACLAAGVREITTGDLGFLHELEDGQSDAIVAADALTNTDRPRHVAIANWLRCVKPGGYVCIFEPDVERVSPNDLMSATNAQSGVDVVRFEAWPPGGTILVLQKRADGEGGVTLSFQAAKPEKTACVVRHGGIGDQLQAAYILPELKRQGYHVTFLTTPEGRALIEHDPHVDDWYMVERNQVPNAELGWFWKVTSRHYDKFVNLNESVERVFLAPPNSVQHQWPAAVRHKWMNGNYAEHAAAVAEIPFVPEGRFYATPAEIFSAIGKLGDIDQHMNGDFVIGMRSNPVFVILWVLAGSSPHKFTPWQDLVIEQIHKRLPRAHVILVGDEACKILEAGWEEHPRVTCLSGALSVRETLALAQKVDLVIGPETGVMNAVCYEHVHKVLMLSHSSRENLSKHWVNTVSIEGRSHCWPCHQLHYTAEFCPQHPQTGAAMCQAGVHPEDLYRPIDAEYTAWARVKMLMEAAA